MSTSTSALRASSSRCLSPTIRIWIHDYHLIPLAEALRRRGVENPIGFFLHIPVPPAQTFLAIPEHEALAKALAAYDLIGLQTAPTSPTSSSSWRRACRAGSSRMDASASSTGCSR